MFYRFRTALGLALLLTLAFAVPVLAGGWAVITLDELPTGIVAGKPLTIGFTVLQHGRTPMTDIAPTITAKSSSGEEFMVKAVPDGKPGHYTAILTFPKGGDWQWSIQAFTMDQTMPVLSVSEPVVASGSQPVVKTEPVPASISPLLIVRALALVVGLFSLVMAYRRRSRQAIALTVLCLLVGVASFMVGATTPAVEAQGKSSSESLSASSISQVELGRQLFIAKGCITCHSNTRAAGSMDYWTIDNGAPNLSKFSASPEALRLRLKDPSSVKSDTQMPNLNLSEVEIEALIAFINSK